SLRIRGRREPDPDDGAHDLRPPLAQVPRFLHSQPLRVHRGLPHGEPRLPDPELRLRDRRSHSGDPLRGPDPLLAERDLGPRPQGHGLRPVRRDRRQGLGGGGRRVALQRDVQQPARLSARPGSGDGADRQRDALPAHPPVDCGQGAAGGVARCCRVRLNARRRLAAARSGNRRMLGLSLVVLMLVFLFLGMPVAFALGVAGAIGLYAYGGFDTVSGILGTVPYRSAAHYTLSTLPMFILMAQFVSVSGIVDDVFTAAQRWLQRLPGGLAITTIFAAAGMAAMSGSSTASAATLSTMAVPQMVKHGYSPRVATGVVTVAGTLAIMIPPSIAFVLYGIITETSIGRLLIAGIIPGILTAAVYCIGIVLWSRLSPGSMPASTARFTFRQKVASLRNLWPFMILASIVIGSMYGGLATPTEAAAFGAFGSLVIPLAMGRMSFASFRTAVVLTMKSTTMIFAIIIGAMIFGYFLTITESTQRLIDYIAALEVNR